MKLTEMNSAELNNFYETAKKDYDEILSRNLKLNMARGKPSAAQLDLALGVLEALHARYEFANSKGDDVRNYGIWDGLDSMKAIFSDMMEVPSSQVIIGNNSSLGIMFDVMSRGMTHGFSGQKPWARLEKKKWLCPCPGYDRHFGITEYFDFEMIPIPMLETGPDMDMVEELIKDESVKGIWCVPKYSNPTGLTYSDETVRRFARLHPAAKDFRIMWDNAYCIHDLTDTPETLLNLWDEAIEEGTEDNVFIFASTSKITFPGAGVAAMAASDRNIVDLKRHFTVETIGPDKLNQLRHVLFFHDINGVKEIMQEHRAILEPKFRKVCEVLEEEIGNLGLAEWNMPNGGYFINCNVMNGCAKRVFNLCRQAGVIITDAGATFPYGNDPQDSNIRIAPSFPPIEELEEAIRVFSTCVKFAAAEKLLNK
ncbi:MAG: aminotransferase class I/II-fold pyridoxal phosphate-dependent enzyme [Clostridia bacterium]|nr:aminotransferase class I/II-fold pyridoxal phosphate-dependent enzyme [Clostridia bacterium]